MLWQHPQLNPGGRGGSWEPVACGGIFLGPSQGCRRVSLRACEAGSADPVQMLTPRAKPTCQLPGSLCAVPWHSGSLAPALRPEALPPWQGDLAWRWRLGDRLKSLGEGSGLSAGLTVSQLPPACTVRCLIASLNECSPVWGGGSDTFGTVCVSSHR